VPHLTYANVVATIALFIALGGSSYAVIDSSGGPTARTAAGCSGHNRDCTGLNLDGRSFKNMDLTQSTWDRASLVGASFQGSDLFGSSFDGANLRNANLSHGNRTQSDFRGADMRNTNLRSADFWGSDLRNADLREATFNGTKMDRTDLTGANLRGAKITSSSFHDAVLCRTIQPNGTTRNDDCGSGDSGGIPDGG
jgi:uncharacterized protein YjbI with pentapeptide repeats